MFFASFFPFLFFDVFFPYSVIVCYIFCVFDDFVCFFLFKIFVIICLLVSTLHQLYLEIFFGLF